MEAASIQHKLRIREQLEDYETSKTEMVLGSLHNSRLYDTSPKKEQFFQSRKFSGFATFYNTDGPDGDDENERPESANHKSISNW